MIKTYISQRMIHLKNKTVILHATLLSSVERDYLNTV